jgi:hypothetical protein
MSGGDPDVVIHTGLIGNKIHLSLADGCGAYAR